MAPLLLPGIHQYFDWAAKVAAVLVSLLGALTGANIKNLVEWAIRGKRKEISAEADENFVVYTVSHRDQGRAADVLGGALFSRIHATESTFKPQASVPAEIAKKQVRVRLEEIIEERERQKSTANWSRNTSRTLTFGQYIIGAMLTSSLVQDSLPKTWLGVFGLLVILCSAAKQHFNVDENAQASDALAKKLGALVRQAQDQIAILEAKSAKGEDRTDAFIDLLNNITETFNQIETPGVANLLAKAPASEPAET